MKENLAKNKKLVIIALLSITFTLWADTINNTCLASIYAEFANSSAFLSAYVVTGPYLVSIPFVLTMGKIAEKIDKKALMIFSLILYTLGGAGGAFAQSMLMFAVFRTICGVATCLISSLAFSIIFENFPNANESAKVMGIYQAFSTGYGAILGVIAGILCTKSWRYAHHLNAMAILSAIIVFVFLPKSQKAKPSDNMSTEKEELPVDDGKIDTPRLVLTLAEALFSIVFTFVFTYYISLYVKERALGTSALTGILAALGTIGGVLANLFLDKLFEKIQRYLGVYSVLLCAACVITVGFDIPVWLVIGIALINGFVNSIVCSFYPIAVNMYAPPSKASFCQSLYCCLLYLGFFLCSYVPYIYIGLFSCGYQKAMLINGIVLLAGGLISLAVIKGFVAKQK